jgi:hypothetical protein
MTEQELYALRYPIGTFQKPETITGKHIQLWIKDIELLPNQFSNVVQNMTDEQLDTPYRPGGWTVRQTIHHVADSHANGYIRLKLALTEDNPTIKPYEEQFWAELPDSKLDIGISLSLIENIHIRWVTILQGMTVVDFTKTFYHPGSQISYPLDVHTGTYSWHGRHHLAHIENLKMRMGW